MIPSDSLQDMGYVIKPHGVRGEMSVFLEEPYALPENPQFFFFNIEGLMVPFEVAAFRMRGSQGALITFEDIDSDTAAAAFSGKNLYFPKDQLIDFEDEDSEDEDGFFLKDVIGYQAKRGDQILGTVTDYNDSTANILFIITTPEGTELLVPVAEEFISDIDTDNKIIDFDIPDGLINL